MYGYNYYQPQAEDSRIWVQNEAGAEAYLLAPNSFVRLWDSQKQYFYEKRSDPSGRPLPITKYRYERCEMEENGAKQQKADKSIYEDLEAIKARLTAIEGKVNNDSEPGTDDTEV